MHEVYVGVGSNIDPEANVRRAVAGLSMAFGPIECSRVYRSRSYGFDGPDFLNLVVRFSTDASSATVEDTLSVMEQEGGRSGDRRGGSRTLDLDLLLYGLRVAAHERLPREDVLAYPFVLAPLHDLVPSLPHPVTGISVDRAIEAMRAHRDMPTPVTRPETG